MVAWPSVFPNPETGMSVQFESPVAQTEMDSGEFRIRPNRRGRRYTVRVSFMLTGSFLAMFNAWFKHKIREGLDPISFPNGLPIEGGDFLIFEAYMTESGYNAQLEEPPKTFKVSFQIEYFRE